MKERADALEQRPGTDVNLDDRRPAVDVLDAKLFDAPDGCPASVAHPAAEKALDVNLAKAVVAHDPGNRSTTCTRSQSSIALIGVASTS